MKKTILRSMAAILLIAMAICAAGCKKQSAATDAEAGLTDVPVITRSPDGTVTAGPTATPEATPAEGTDDPGATGGPDETAAPGETTPPDETAGPGAATPAPGTTTPAPGTATPTPGTATPTPGTATPTPGTATPTPGTATPVPGTATPDVPHPSEPNSYVASYAGAEVDCTSLKVNDTFYWTLDLVNEHSCLYAALFLVEYNERLLQPIDYSFTWSGGLSAAITAAWDDDEAWSDKPFVYANLVYDGNTGANPYGETGKKYSIVGLSLLSFDYGGIQASGSIVRITYKLLAKPAASDLVHDGKGDYLPLNITVIQSSAMVDKLHSVTHGTITVTGGKLYFKH